MAYVNVSIPTEGDVRAEQYRYSAEKERDFWLKKSEELRDQLENVLDAANEHGYVELRHRGERLVLYTWDKARELTEPL
ncbi:MAG: hypothetical protein IJ935_07395 [Afipia sp.]|nr:hypothetical protein [Afipia sp.]